MKDQFTANHHEVSFDLPIKSVMPNEDGSCVLIETVDNQSKTQSFYLCKPDSLEIIQAFTIDVEYYGVVVRYFDNERILLVQYSNQNNPDQTNIYSFSWNGGLPLLTLNDTRIIASGPGWIQVPHPHFTGKKVYMDISTGNTLDAAPDEKIVPPAPLIKYATQYAETSEYFEWFRQYFNKHGIVPTKQVEYIKTDGHALVSYYQADNDGLTNMLAIIDDQGGLHDAIVLDENLPGIGRDNFFVLRNKVIFVTNKINLHIYEL